MADSDSAEDIADDIFRHELKASEKMGEMFTNYEPEEAEDALVASFGKIASNIESPERLQRLVRLTEGVGQRLGSEQIVNAAYDVAEESDILEVDGGE